ncbi:Gp46 [Mycolicibacterium canariasense]|uniref:Gp46 n=1 Tax=Mycolicibacterium canariasense TaxID=228230 RepID=A0A100WIJ6_MYCCR|nr:Gp46 [Mycolicibacterium canariasense]
MPPKPSDMPARRPGTECPTPAKHAYRSQARALRAQRALRLPAGQKDHLHPYRCPGGHWHLTHQTPAEQAEVARRIRRYGRRKPA